MRKRKKAKEVSFKSLHPADQKKFLVAMRKEFDNFMKFHVFRVIKGGKKMMKTWRGGRERNRTVLRKRRWRRPTITLRKFHQKRCFLVPWGWQKLTES